MQTPRRFFETYEVSYVEVSYANITPLQVIYFSALNFSVKIQKKIVPLHLIVASHYRGCVVFCRI